jgi:hypothetical protein
LDLKTRLFRFPLSYLIYTQEFQQLPSDVMKLIRAKLATELDLPERQAEREILNETLPGFLSGKPSTNALDNP